MSKFPKLNFPEYDFTIKQQNGKLYIFDIIRQKMIALTPEEWVRQHLIHYLVKEQNYPSQLLQVEYGLTISGKPFRVDVAAFSNKYKPILLCECKAPTIMLSIKTIEQAAKYNIHQQAPFLLITNGLEHYCSYYNGLQWQILNEIPNFKQLLQY
jgi:hypothetical protein